jgi:pilus assembly protein CpaC
VKPHSRHCVSPAKRIALLLALGWFGAGSGAAQQLPPGAAEPVRPAPQPAPNYGSPAEAQAETLRMLTGRSLVVRTPLRIKRILVGDPAVLESVLTSPYEVVLTAKHTGGSSVVLWQENGQSRMMEVSADLDVTSLRGAIEETYPDISVEVQSQEAKVVLVGTVPSEPIAEQISKMAGNFSKEVVNGLRIAKPSRPKQIMLKVRFAEADRNKLTAFGINLFSTGATNTLGTMSTQQFGTQSLNPQSSGNGALSQFNLSDLLNIFLFRPDINLGATIKDLQQKQVLQILAEPNLVAIHGQPAHFLAGGEFPYPVVQNSAAGYPSIAIQFKPYGVKLEFTGYVEDDAIRLKVAPEVSSLDYTNTVTISGFVMPAIQSRRAETELQLKNGQTFGIAGLLDQRTTVQLSRVPGIADVPVLGELFKSRNVSRTNTELVVLVTPSIVDPVAGDMGPAKVQVDMPVQNLNNQQFDHKLPLANPAPKGN